jgi:hypothetical protein
MDDEPMPRILKIGLIVGLTVFYGLLILVGLTKAGDNSAAGPLRTEGAVVTATLL